MAAAAPIVTQTLYCTVVNELSRRLKVANARFSGGVNNQYECTFDAHAEIRPAQDDSGIKKCSFDFTPIDRLEGLEENPLRTLLEAQFGTSNRKQDRVCERGKGTS